jgi:hypothetical protein
MFIHKYGGDNEVGYGYLDITNPNFTYDLLTRKEFYQFEGVRPYVLKYYETSWIDQKIRDERMIFLQGHQMFVKNYMNPTTPYKKLLLQYPTGSGKTIGTLSISVPFIIKSRAIQEVPKVNIIGFSKQIFVNELLRQPFFGFVTNEEVDELGRLQNLLKLGSINKQVYVNYRKKLKQRLAQYFTFYGYKEFANIVLNLGESDMKEFMSKFEGSVVIFDEIHNVYNSTETNNYGSAILKLIENVQDLRTIFASATITTNSRTEILDFLPLLTSSYGNITHYNKDDFFDGKSGERELNPGAVAIIKEAIKGKVSYVEEIDPSVYPERIILGEKIPDIDYLKFIRCPMSPLHNEAYEYVQKVGIDEKVPLDGRMLTDIVVPVPCMEPTVPFNPPSKSGDIHEIDKESNGEQKGYEDKPSPLCVDYLNKEVLYKVGEVDQEWRNRYGIEIHDKIISGSFLKKENIGTYSTKYSTFIEDCLHVNANNDGKMLVFHPYVYGSGVTMIAEILKENGFIDETMMTSPNTICAVCGITYEKHNSETHRFEPAKFLLVHSDMDVLSRDNKISLFNNPKNTMGHEYKILVGSKVIKEREDFKAVRHLFALGIPDNIPSLIQVFGRAVRRESHILLPPDKRQVYIKIYVSSKPGKNIPHPNPLEEKEGSKETVGSLTYEEDRYRKKVSDYKVIQQIEKVFHEAAIDAQLFKSTVKEGLNSIPYSADSVLHNGREISINYDHIKLEESKKIVFQSLYSRDEIDCIKYAIRRLFVEKSRIFKVVDIIHELRNVGFYTPINPKYFLDINIKMAIHELIYNKNKVQFPVKNFVYGLLGRSYLNSQIIKTVDGVDNVIIKVKEYLILTVLQKPKDTPIGAYGTPYKVYTGFPILDVDCWQRLIIPPDNLKVNVTRLSLPYELQRREFYLRYKDTKVKHLLESINDFDMTFHERFIREIIEYYFRLLNNEGGMSEYHEFYLNMLYIYDKFGVIIFASYIRDTQFYNMYSEYYLDRPKDKDSDYSMMMKRHSNFLSSHEKRKAKTIHLKLEKLNTLINKKKAINKVPDTYLPIGYMIKNVILYHDKSWRSYSIDMSFNPKYSVENDIVVGFYEQSKLQLEIKFKLRPPVQMMSKFEDARRNERGTFCNSFKKKDLLLLLDKLGIETDTTKIGSICKMIKHNLIHRELEERRRYWTLSEEEQRKHPIKRWFYMHFENPEL